MNEIEKRYEFAERITAREMWDAFEETGKWDDACERVVVAAVQELESRAIALGYTKDQRDKLFGESR